MAMISYAVNSEINKIKKMTKTRSTTDSLEEDMRSYFSAICNNSKNLREVKYRIKNSNILNKFKKEIYKYNISILFVDRFKTISNQEISIMIFSQLGKIDTCEITSYTNYYREQAILKLMEINPRFRKRLKLLEIQLMVEDDELFKS